MQNNKNTATKVAGKPATSKPKATGGNTATAKPAEKQEVAKVNETATAVEKTEVAKVTEPVDANEAKQQVPMKADGGAKFRFGTNWPANSGEGKEIRGYCKIIAKRLTAEKPEGFTIGEYAEALFANQAEARENGFRLPCGDAFGKEKPNGKAREHARYFATKALYLDKVEVVEKAAG